MNILINLELRLWTCLFVVQVACLLLTSIEAARLRCPDVSPCRCRIRNRRREKEDKAVDIDCRNRNLQMIPDLSLLKGIPISVLQITYNNISSIEADSFNGLYLNSVQSHGTPPLLKLDGNPIRHISDHAFRGLMADSVLVSMEYTHLDRVPTLTLLDLENITQLYLGNNNITHIPDRAFAQLKKLESISLSNNPIGHLSAGVFVGADMLHDLSLKNISIQSFPTEALKRIRLLKTINLNENSISTLDDYAFGGFQTWEEVKLSMSNNGLMKVSPQAFNTRDTMMRLVQLHLDHNKVTNMSFMYKPCTPLFRALGFQLHIEHNPVLCDCEFYNMASQGLYAIKGRCAKPDIFRGVRFDTLWHSEGTAIFQSDFGPLAMKHCGPANSTHCQQDLFKIPKHEEQGGNGEEIIIEVAEDVENGHQVLGGKDTVATYEATGSCACIATHQMARTWQLVVLAATLYRQLCPA